MHTWMSLISTLIPRPVLQDEKFTCFISCLVFVPPSLNHCGVAPSVMSGWVSWNDRHVSLLGLGSLIECVVRFLASGGWGVRLELVCKDSPFLASGCRCVCPAQAAHHTFFCSSVVTVHMKLLWLPARLIFIIKQDAARWLTDSIA